MIKQMQSSPGNQHGQQKEQQNEQQESQHANALMVLTIGKMELLIPQQDITSYENINQLDTKNLCKNSLGWIKSVDTNIPVYGLTAEFDFLRALPLTKSICVILNGINMAIICDEIKAFTVAEVDFQPLPDCMDVAGTPVASFCVYKQADVKIPGMVFTAMSLKNYISRSNNFF